MSPITESHDILDAAGAARILNCSRNQVYLLLAGKISGIPPIPHVRIGHRGVRIRKAALMRWWEEQEKQ